MWLASVLYGWHWFWLVGSCTIQVNSFSITPSTGYLTYWMGVSHLDWEKSGLESILVCWDCHNKISQTGCLKQWKWKSLSCVRPFASPWNSPGHNIGVGSLSLLQGIFLTQELNRALLSCRRVLYQLSSQGSPSISIMCAQIKGKHYRVFFGVENSA